MAATKLAQLLETHDRERRDLARHLHGTCAQQLTALQMNLEAAVAAADALPPRSARLLADCASIAIECAREIRGICGELHPALLDEFGLDAALRFFCGKHGVAMKLPESLPRLRPETALGLYRIVEEAAPLISALCVEYKAGSLVLELDLPRATPLMRTRVRVLGGRFGRRREGLRIVVPLKTRRR